MLLAHQGGWDEIILVAGPIVVVAGLLLLARRRVTRAEHPSASRGDAAHGPLERTQHSDD